MSTTTTTPSSTKTSVLLLVQDLVDASRMQELVGNWADEICCAEDEGSALLLLLSDPMSMLIVDGRLGDGRVRALLQTLRARDLLRSLPVVVWGLDYGNPRRLRTLEAGADEVVGRSAGGAELRTRLAALMRRCAYERELQQRIARQEALLEGAREAVLLVDGRGHVLASTRDARRRLDLTPDLLRILDLQTILRRHELGARDIELVLTGRATPEHGLHLKSIHADRPQRLESRWLPPRDGGEARVLVRLVDLIPQD